MPFSTFLLKFLILEIPFCVQERSVEKMASSSVDDITSVLETTRVTPNGISFAGKSLKLDTEEDAKQVTDAIDKCTDLQFLNLEGNTLGVDASKSIAKSLEKHPEFKQALWKDMFTGRMKTEIPKALEYLGNGLRSAGALLTKLDLSDNAFGPIGVQGLAAFLRSPSCYALEELLLNNNGLGITGGKLLAQALTDCYNSSREAGKALSLKVFVAGRNRLENDGAKSLAQVFKMLGTLEEIAMPQNGIYHPGIAALSDAFTHNRNLQIINLNDNTIGGKGAAAIAKALPSLQKLREINFGDCLLKTQGAISLANSLRTGHINLEELTLDHNEIRFEGGIEIVKAAANKGKLKSLNLNGNQFGSEGRSSVKKELKDVGKLNTLGSLSEDESDDEEQEQDNNDDEESEAEVEATDEENNTSLQSTSSKTPKEFLENPTAEHFLSLGDNRTALLLAEAMPKTTVDLDVFVPVLMKVSSLSNSTNEQAAKLALDCSKELYRQLYANTKDPYDVSNTILINLGLLKSETKYKSPWNLAACRLALRNALKADFLNSIIKDMFYLFLDSPDLKR